MACHALSIYLPTSTLIAQTVFLLQRGQLVSLYPCLNDAGQVNYHWLTAIRKSNNKIASPREPLGVKPCSDWSWAYVSIRGCDRLGQTDRRTDQYTTRPSQYRVGLHTIETRDIEVLTFLLCNSRSFAAFKVFHSRFFTVLLSTKKHKHAWAQEQYIYLEQRVA